MAFSAQSQIKTTSFVAARPCRVRALPVSAAVKKQSVCPQQGEEATAFVKVGLGFATSAVMLFNVFASPVSAQEVASIAADSALDDAAEVVRTLIPTPDGLFDKEKAAQKAEAQEKRAVNASESSFRAASPVGGEGEVSNLADQGLKGGPGFQQAADKLNTANSGQQYANATELDKKLQKEDDYAREAQFKKDSPGQGNSTIDRAARQITGGGDKPQAPSAAGIFGFGK